jgi:hypothetical protein
MNDYIRMGISWLKIAVFAVVCTAGVAVTYKACTIVWDLIV